MDVFNVLMVGHLVGDWLLQNDWMAKGKKKGLLTFAGFVHYTIYTLAIVITLRLLAPNDGSGWSYLVLGSVIFISHWFIDSTKLVEAWMRFFQQSNSLVVQIMVDQTLHILILAILAYGVLRV